MGSSIPQRPGNREMNVVTESELMAQATADAMIAAASAAGVGIPRRIAEDLQRMCAATGQRVVKVTHGRTAREFRPAGPLPAGVSMARWQEARLTQRRMPPNWPGVATREPEPCYLVYVTGNGITAEFWLKDAGYEAFSNAPFCTTLREIRA